MSKDLRPGATIVPFYLDEMVRSGKVYVDGFFKLFFDALMDRFNITNPSAEYVSISENLDFGVVYENGTCTGSLGFVACNKSDFTMTGVGYSTIAFRYVEYAIPETEETWKIISGIPLKKKEVVMGALAIFSPMVWGSILVSVFFFSFVWKYASRKITGENTNQSYARSLFYASTCLLNKVMKYDDKYIGSRIAWASWIFCSFCLSSAFVGCLLSQLTLPDLEERINTIEDLLKHPELQVVIFDDPEILKVFEKSPDLKAVIEQAKRTDGLKSYDNINIGDVFDDILDGKSVLILSVDAVMITMHLLGMCNDANNLKFHFSEEILMKEVRSKAIRRGLNKNSIELIKDVIFRINEGGLLHKKIYFEAWKGSRCIGGSDQSSTEDTRLGFKTLVMPLYILGTGLALGFVIVVREVFVWNAKVNKLRKARFF